VPAWDASAAGIGALFDARNLLNLANAPDPAPDWIRVTRIRGLQSGELMV